MSHTIPGKRGFSRRQFLFQTLGLTTAGLAVGGGAAWTKSRLEVGAAAEAQAQALQTQLAGVSAEKSALDLSLSTLNSQLADLQMQLNAVLSQNAELASALSVSQQETADLQMQLAGKQAELEAANGQLAQSKELISLYTLLDSINLDAVAEAGLAAVSGGLTAALGLATALREGLSSASQRLLEFEQSLPDIQEAINWVGEQVVILKLGLYAVELAAQRALNELLTGLDAAFGGFARFILEHLPFGIGEDVKHTLAATQNLLVSLPGVAEGLNEKVLNRISPHVNEGAKDWKRSLVEPVRAGALTPAGDLLQQLASTQATFVHALQEPAQTALQRRAELRQQIAAFRAAHQI